MHSIISIMAGTPLWVYGVFAYLMWVGYQATKDRVIWVPRLFIIPAILTGLKYKFFLTASSLALLSYGCWMLIGLLGGLFVASRSNFIVDRQTRTVRLKGSYQTLVLLVIVFSIKYVFGYLNSTAPDIALEYRVLEYGISALISGFFLGRSLWYLKSSGR